jgi:hypothetical protein
MLGRYHLLPRTTLTNVIQAQAHAHSGAAVVQENSKRSRTVAGFRVVCCCRMIANPGKIFRRGGSYR